jgi:hypothetical protein
VRDGDVDADESGGGQGPDGLRQQLRGHREELVTPVVES